VAQSGLFQPPRRILLSGVKRTLFDAAHHVH
jgi:hypothetical protein